MRLLVALLLAAVVCSAILLAIALVAWPRFTSTTLGLIIFIAVAVLIMMKVGQFTIRVLTGWRPSPGQLLLTGLAAGLAETLIRAQGQGESAADIRSLTLISGLVAWLI